MARPIEHKIEDIIKAADEYVQQCEAGIHDFPSITRLALKLHINRDTLYEKAKNSVELSDTLSEIKTYQELALQEKGLTKVWDSGFAKFLLSASHGLKETTAQELSGKDGKDLNIKVINYGDNTSL